MSGALNLKLLTAALLVMALMIYQNVSLSPAVADDIDSQAEIDMVGPDDLPVIFQWIERDDLAKIEAYLDAGGNIEVPGFQSATPLIYAAGADSWVVSLALVRRGADLTAVDRRGFNMPWLAATSRVKPGSREHAALLEVRRYLEDAGLSGPYIEPNAAKALMADRNCDAGNIARLIKCKGEQHD